MHTNPAERPFSLAQTGRRGFRAASVALLSLALVAGAALVATPASAAPAASAAVPNTGVISGIVTSAKTGEPLSDISVTLLGAFDPLGYDENYVTSDETDAAGQYSFPRLPAGDYRVVFEDYSSEWDDEPVVPGTDSYLSQFFGGEPGDYSGEVDPITVDTTTVTIDQALTVAGKYTGRVLTSAGKPAANVYVYAITEDDFDYSTSEAVTAKDGSYVLDGLPYGETVIYTDATRTAPSTVTTPAPITAAKPTVKVAAIKQSVGSFITGRVLTSAGEPASGVVMIAQNVGTNVSPFDAYVGQSRSNKNGEYRVGPLLPGKYAPLAADPASDSFTRQYLGGSTDVYLARTVTVTKPGSTISREFRLAKRASLTGVVLSASGARVKDTSVLALQADGTGSLVDNFRSDEETYTNSKGQYTIKNLNPGSYTALIGDTTTSAGTPTWKDLVLKPGVNKLVTRLGGVTNVSGIVTSSSGTALKGVTVDAVPVSNACLENFSGLSGPIAVTTSATGAYSIPLAPGDWTLRFTDPTGRTSSAYLGGGDYPTDAASTVLATSASVPTITNQNVALSTSGVTVSAYVKSPGGTSDVAGAVTVERLVDDEVVDSNGPLSCTYGSYYDEAPINDEFPLLKLSDGDYRVTIQPMLWINGFEPVDTVVEFTVAGGAVTVIDGEAAADGTTLGDITLAAPTRSAEPSPLEQPTISAPEGAIVGATLSAVTDYPGLESGFSSYQWLRNGRPIAGALSPDYVVQSGDVGSVLTFQFTGYGDAGWIDVLTSTPSVIVQGSAAPVSEDAPTISGSARVDGTLTAVPAKGDPKGTIYGYQWNINGQELLAVTTKTFTPRIQDLGETITVTVTKTLPGTGFTTGATSAGVTVKHGKAIVLSKAVLLVDGKSTSKLRLGKTLSVAVKGLPADGVGVSYQWQVNRGKGWSSFAGKTSNTLTLSKKTSTANKVGFKYRVVVSVERSSYDKSKSVASNSLKAAKASKKK